MDETPLYVQQAEAFLAQKNYQKVIEITSAVIDSKTSSVGDLTFALQLRCGVYLEIEDYSNALADANMLIHQIPNVYLGYYQRGIALFNLDQLDKAKDDFIRCMTMPLTPAMQYSVYVHLGYIAYREGNYDTAVQHYLQAIPLAPSDNDKGRVYYHMGVVAFSRNDGPAAQNAFRTAYQLSPSDAQILAGVAVLNAAVGYWNEAVETWRDLVASIPHFTDPDEVAHHYFRWTPSMADLARQIIARM